LTKSQQVVYRPDTRPVTQPSVSYYWRKSSSGWMARAYPAWEKFPI